MEPGLRPGRSHGCLPSHNLPAMLAIAWSPDEHCLLTADKGTVSGMSLKQEARKSAPLSLPSTQGKQARAPGQPDCPFVGELGGGRTERPGEQTGSPARTPGDSHWANPSLQALAPQAPQAHALPSSDSPQPRPSMAQSKRRLAGSCLGFEGSKVKLYNPLSPRARVSSPQSMGEYQSLAC